MGLRKKDIQEVGQELADSGFTDVWFQDPDAQEHYHHDQTEGDKHMDLYHMTADDDGNAHIDKRHTDDEPKPEDGTDKLESLRYKK